MTRFLAVAIVFLSSVPAYAMPQFLELYRKDPFRNANVDGCITCHVSPQGGDARNAFGQGFEMASYQITAMLRAQFPDQFVYPIARVSGALTVYFSDPDKKQVVIETGGMKNLVDVDRASVNGVPATTTTTLARAVTPESQGEQTEVPVDQDAREGAFFGANIVNLPNGKPQEGGGVDFFIGHRFSRDVSSAGLSNLFGFDSAAVVAFGIRAGLSDRLSVSALRSNYFKTISLSSAFQVTRQSRTMPLTLQVRSGVDGLDNFSEQYSPFIQVVATRTFKDRFSVTAVPMYAFNTRNEQTVDPEVALGVERNDTMSLGIGAGVRLRPTVSLVGEFVPRLWGFKNDRLFFLDTAKDLARFSIGLQKATFRHTFELLISRQVPMTPAHYSFQGVDTFRVGFNIYRKLR